MVMLKLWMAQSGNRVTGNTLEKALRKIGRDDIVNQCIFNVELVTDDLEKAVAKTRLDQPGFDQLRAEVATPVSDAGSIGGGNRQTRDIERNPSLDVSFDEQDLMKVFFRNLLSVISPSPPFFSLFYTCFVFH